MCFMNDHQIRILRAARAYLGLKQEEVSERSGVTTQTISNLESEKSDGADRTLRKLRDVYESFGIVFTGNGMEYQPYKTAFFESFLDVLTDAEESLKKGDELLLHCADERRNLDGVTDKFTDLRKKGIRIRMTYEDGNKFITGPKEDYRWIDRELFANSQVEVVYRDKYFFHFQDQGRNIFVMTKNKAKANSAKKEFEYHWSRGKKWADV